MVARPLNIKRHSGDMTSKCNIWALFGPYFKETNQLQEDIF